MSDRLALNLQETAKALGVSVPTVYALLRSGQIAGRRLGRRWLVDVSSIRRWLSEADENGGGVDFGR